MGYSTYWDTFNCIQIKDYIKIKEILEKCEYKELFKFSNYVDSNTGNAIWSLSIEDKNGVSDFSHSSIEELEILPELCKYLKDFEILVWDYYSLYESGSFYKVINKNGKFDYKKLELREKNK